MLFSFIIPVYNTSKYLDKCLASVLCQKGADYEILLIDDGSTDNSGDLCDAYAEKYPNIVRVIHKENEGLLLTRRRGFKEAKGDWFICIDSDDYANSRLLESVVKAVDEYNPDMVMYNFSYSNDDGVITKSRLDLHDESVYDGKEKQYIYSKRLLTDDINNMWSKAIKREIVDIKTDYSNSGIRNMCEDAVQVLPLFTKAKKIIYLAEPLYYYRKGHSSITGGRTYENWLASKTCFLITEGYLDVWRVSDELRDRYYTQTTELLSNYLRWLFSQHGDNLSLSVSEIIHNINTHPGFLRCLEHYNKNYSRTSYLKFSVPKLMRYVKSENIKALKRYFAMEKKLLFRK